MFILHPCTRRQDPALLRGAAEAQPQRFPAVVLLRRAKRARVSFEGEDVTKPSSLIIDTELIRYKWVSNGGNFPEWQQLIPTEFNTFASFDTVEAIKAVNSLKTLSDKPKDYPIDLTIGDGKVVMANPDDKGQAELVADTDGEVKVRIDGQYLAQALRACGGMVEFKLVNAYSPMLFTANGYQLVVMPMLTSEGQKAEAERAKAEVTPTEQAEPEATEPKAKGKGKGKSKGKTEPVAEAEPEPEAEDTEAEQAEDTEPVTEEAEKAQAVAETEAVVKAEKPKRSRKKEPVAVA